MGPLFNDTPICSIFPPTKISFLGCCSQSRFHSIFGFVLGFSNDFTKKVSINKGMLKWKTFTLIPVAHLSRIVHTDVFAFTVIVHTGLLFPTQTFTLLCRDLYRPTHPCGRFLSTDIAHTR